MYGWMLFIHVAGLAAWFGATLMGVLMLVSLRKKLAESNLASVALSVIKNVNRVAHPAATLVLLSGGIMVMDWDHSGLPFWLAIMERGGGMVILLFLIVMSILGSKLKKKLSAGDSANAAKSIGTYVTWTVIFLIAILAVTLIVSLKL